MWIILKLLSIIRRVSYNVKEINIIPKWNTINTKIVAFIPYWHINQANCMPSVKNTRYSDSGPVITVK